MTNLNSAEMLETFQIEVLSTEDTIESLITQISYSEYPKASIPLKPVLSKLIILFLVQPMDKLESIDYGYLFDNLHPNLMFFLLEQFSYHIETKSYISIYIINNAFKRISYNWIKYKIDNLPILNILKTILNTSQFDLNFNIPMITSSPHTNDSPKISIGLLISNAYPLLRMQLKNLNIKIENNEPIAKQKHNEITEYIKYLHILPIKLALKSQSYNSTLLSNIPLSTTGNFQRIMELENVNLIF